MTTSEELPPPGYEPQDASPRLIGLMGLALAVLIAGTLAASAWVYHSHYAHAPTARYDAREMSFGSGATWQSSIARDWTDLDQRTRRNLTTYGWIDRRAGIVRIPIERAMALVAQEAKP